MAKRDRGERRRKGEKKGISIYNPLPLFMAWSGKKQEGEGREKEEEREEEDVERTLAFLKH